MRDYQPVSCDFVDQIEIAAMRGKSGTIRYHQEGIDVEIEDQVKTWVTENKVEYLITSGGAKIRLDQITWLIDQPGPTGKC